MTRLRRMGYAVSVFAIMLTTLCLVRYWPRPALANSIARSSAVYARGGKLLRLTLTEDGQYRLWTPLSSMPPRLPEAVLLYEDRTFYWHPGINPFALIRAALSNLRGGRRLGGSTISMQLARHLYRLDSHSLSGKIEQMGLALWLEARYGKREILETYLNIAPYGGNVEGVGAASLAYFGRRVSELSIAQVITLAVVPQNPEQRRPSMENVYATQRRDAARARLWADWLVKHPRDAEFSADIKLADGSSVAKALPFAAPHFTDAMLREHRGSLDTTLDLTLQRHLERILTRYINEQSSLGIRNAGALLLEVTPEAAEVRAYVGSADYKDPGIEGQVNAVLAKRSPGSLLKPFVYALGMDQGLLHPRTILKDAPTAFGPFSPENFDGRFVGPIAAEDALVRSRNVPAVEVASRLSRPTLYDYLTSSGVSQLRSERFYGLALALGGGEVSMEELARMYATLESGGRLPPVRALAAEEAPMGPRLLSEEASFITLDMLAKNIRPDTGQPAAPRVAWKTGTSWGFHDAWSAAVFDRHVLIVWVGNFDNTENPAFIGVQAAAPLLFRIIDGLRAQALVARTIPRRPPAGVSRVEVCAASGDLPNAHCPQTVGTWYIPGKSPIRESSLHQAIFIDAEGERVCGPGTGVHEEVYEFWSTDMLRLFREAGLPRRTPPPAPDCTGSVSAAIHEPPRIASPLRGVTYSIRAGRSESLLLKANASSESRTVYWFVGKEYLGSSLEGLAWRPGAAGHYVLHAVDEYGSADSREIDVALID